MSKLRIIGGFALAAVMLIGIQAAPTVFAAGKKKASFKVRIENISDKGGVTAVDGSKYPFVASPGLYAATASDLALFVDGRKATKGIEAQAEDGDPEMLLKEALRSNVEGSFGIFNKPLGADMPGPLLPGSSYEFTFTAVSGQRLSFYTMYGQSNDLFYAPATPIELFINGSPVAGDITDKLVLWDAGTEVNEAPGLGMYQGPRQKAKNQGVDESGVVARVRDGFTYPAVKDVLRVTITAN